MKRWGMVLLVMAGFISGIIYVYACGGGGSGAMAAVEAHFHDPIDISPQGTGSGLNADYLDGSDSSDFALSIHSHSGSSSTQYVSYSFLGGVNAWPWTETGKVSNIWDTINGDLDQFANADTSVWWVGRSAVYMDTSHSYEPVYIPVQLPHGAIVVEYGMLYYDENPGAPAPRSYIQRTMSGPYGLIIARVQPSATDFLPQYAWTNTIQNPATAVIDNTLYSYHIRGQVYPQEPMALLSAFVGYKMP